jgi:hypothetical protein
MTSIGWRSGLNNRRSARLGARTDIRLDGDVNFRIDRVDTAAVWR